MITVRHLTLSIGLAIALVVVVAGCGSHAPHPAVAPPVLGKSFSSAAMAVSFRYPVDWKNVPFPHGDRTGDAVEFGGSSGYILVLVNYDYGYSHDKAKAPLPLPARARPTWAR